MLTHSRTNSVFIELKIGGLAAYTFIPMDQTLTLSSPGCFLCLTWSEKNCAAPHLQSYPRHLTAARSPGGGGMEVVVV